MDRIIGFDPKYLDPSHFWSNLECFSLNALDEDLLQEIPTKMIALSKDDIALLTSNMDLITKGEVLDNLPHQSKIDNAISEYGGKAFFKLSVRSPKDSLFYKKRSIQNNQPIEFTVESAVELYQCLFTSLRTIVDIMRSLINDIPVHIVLRKYIAISGWQEFRCFIVDSKLVGVSQYDYENYYSELQGKEELILSLIRKRLNSVYGRIPKTCILDVFIQDFEKVIVLEMNPFGCRAGASLYHNGNHEDFEKNGWDLHMFNEPIKILKDPVKKSQ